MKIKNIDIKSIAKKNIMALVLIAMAIGLAIFQENFLTVKNILGILRGASITGVIAFGMTMVIIGGEIDLSVGSGIGFSAVITATIAGKLASANIMPLEYSIIVAMIVALICGALIGLVNGFLRTRFNIPSFIVTLAMLNVLYGAAAVISKGFPVTTVPSWYSFIGAGSIWIIPAPAIWLVIIFGISLFLMNHTRFGREVYAVGGNPESARLSGINVKKVKTMTMVIVQVLAAFAGIILSSQVRSGSPQFGKGYEMEVISAVIIGGASLSGGRGNIKGTFLGIIFLGILMNGMTLLGVDDYIKYIIRGGIIILAVLVNTLQELKTEN